MNVAVIGGGPAGVMAAITAAQAGAKVYLFDKNGRIGKKLRITGKGRCNITNACESSELINNVPRGGRFLYSAFSRFSNFDLIDFMESIGVATKVERGNRVFPQSDSAITVIDALNKQLKESGVVFIGTEVKGIITDENGVKGISLADGRNVRADAVVLATGGLSYPQTGSTGDGYKMAKQAGHKVTPLEPSLVPLVCAEEWAGKLTGLSLKNVALKITDMSGKKVYEDFGEMLFTHFGISGPIVLSASSHMSAKGQYKAFIDLKPALTEEQLDKRLIRDFEKYAKKDFINSLDDLLPKRLIETVAQLSDIEFHKKTGELTKKQRQGFATLLKALPLTVTGFRPINEAIITSGGVSTNEINPKTMESKLVKNLYFAGEIIDADAYTGGFNLQIAFSTGYLAGKGVVENGVWQ